MKRQLKYFLVVLIGMTVSCLTPIEKTDSLELEDKSTAKNDSIINSDSIKIKQLILEYDLNLIDTFDIGDVDGDGKKDKAIILPLTFYYHNSKIDSQYVNIQFNCNIPNIKHYNGFHGLIANVGDLDGNKTDELIYYPDWYQSEMAGIFIYGYKHKKWQLLGSGSIRRESIRESNDPIAFLKSRVKKVNDTSFKIIGQTWDENQTGFIDEVTTTIIK